MLKIKHEKQILLSLIFIIFILSTSLIYLKIRNNIENQNNWGQETNSKSNENKQIIEIEVNKI